MDISLSTHLFVFHPLDDGILSLFPKYGFPLAELWAMPPHFPYRENRAADAIAEGLARNGVRVASLHAPLYPDVRSYKKDRWYSLSSTDEEHRRISVEATASAAGWLSRNGGGTVVLHTSFPPAQWYPHRWGAFLSSLNELVDVVPAGVRFAIENTPVDSGQVDILLDIVERYPAGRVGVCLDLGHANIQENALDAVRAAGPRLIHVHASDNHAAEDDHLVPGKGSIPWARVLEALREVKFQGPFTVELRDYTRGEDPPYASFDQILSECRNFLDRLLREGA
ncbi:MAG TPA: sugar phosphate isomerase/epimerase [Candidatus Deferrimicrobiaceae bacterium]